VPAKEEQSPEFKPQYCSPLHTHTQKNRKERKGKKKENILEYGCYLKKIIY
jgi:hypothetical protein